MNKHFFQQINRNAEHGVVVDFVIHLLVLASVLLVLWVQGITQGGATPGWLYPCLLVVMAVTGHRIYQWRGEMSVLLPFLLGSVMGLFCLINEMGRDYWAFAMLRQYPVVVRYLWLHGFVVLCHPIIFDWFYQYTKKLDLRFGVGQLIGWGVIYGLLAWLLRNLSISLDGYDWIKHSFVAGDWTYYLREPLGTLIFHLAAMVGWYGFGWEPYVSLAVLIILLGIPTTWVMAKVYQRLFGDRWAMYFALLLGCMGYTQLFFANIEIYPLLQLGLALFLYTALRYLDGKDAVWLCATVFAVLFCVHLSALWFMPAFLLLPLLKATCNRLPNPWWDTWMQWLLFIVIVGGFFQFVAIYGYDGSWVNMVNFFQSIHVLNVGTDAAMFRPIGDYVSWQYYETQLNLYVYTAPAIIVLLPVLIFSIRKQQSYTWLDGWFALLAGAYFVYSLTWNPDRPYPADWDLFSGLSIPLAIFCSILFQRIRLPETSKDYILYQAIVFSWLYVITQIAHNHLSGLTRPLYQ